MHCWRPTPCMTQLPLRFIVKTEEISWDTK